MDNFISTNAALIFNFQSLIYLCSFSFSNINASSSSANSGLSSLSQFGIIVAIP